MNIITRREGKTYSLTTQEVWTREIRALDSEMGLSILKIIAKEPNYPKKIAKNLKIHEQQVYYYIHKLEKAGIIKVVKQERHNGTIAKYYAATSDSFYLRVGDFKESSKLEERTSLFLHPFIDKGELNSIVVVGSPDPHGPLKARSRDGYFGMDFALFLGTFIHNVPESRVKLDTEVSEKELSENNLIVIGGPIVNKVASLIGKRMPIYYDEEKKGFYSTISKKLYVHEEVGVIVKCVNPWNKEKRLLFIAGIRNFGTKAAILTFLKHFALIEKGNTFDNEIMANVVEGVDLNSDGIVDDAEILE